jgi:polysaccharide chain length determinant protein (PEP-CTERM system associated)
MVGTSTAHSAQDPALVIKKYLKEFLELAVRRKWLILSFVVLGIAIGGILAWRKVDMYRSETVIFIEQKKIPEKYVPSVVGGSVAERVSTMTQQVLSRTNLQKIIDEFHLYAEAILSQGYEEATAGLRKNIKILTKGSGGQVEAFTISFAHSDPMMAMKVTARLASQYIEENIKMREQFIEGASEFLQQELIIAKQALDEKEKLLSEYKLRYAGELPRQLDANLRTLNRLHNEKMQIQESLNGWEVRMDHLQKSIQDYEAMAEVLTEFTQAPFQGSGDREGVDPMAMRIAELKRELAKMSGEYTDAYPDIVSLKKQIAKLENELSQRTENIGDGNDLQSGNELEGIDVPVFDTYLAQLINSRDELKVQIMGSRAQLRRVLEKIKISEQRIANTPTREQEMLVLERDYDNMRDLYQQLHQNRTSARISENLDKRQKGERFRILDPANLPTKPEGAPRELIAMGVGAVGSGLGFGLAFLLDLLWPTFRRSEDAEVSLGVATLATIPSFKMAYGASMKMLKSEVESQSGANAQHLALNQSGASLPIRNSPAGDGAEGAGGYAGYRMRTSSEAIPPQMNLVTKWRPQSIVAEQYRVAVTRLDLLDPSHSHQVVLITSAMKGDGKSSTSANIAYTLARDLNEPTLVIDCDFKCPNLPNILGLSQEPGLAEYFAGVEPLEDCLQHMPDMPLGCIAVGNTSCYPVQFSKLQHLSTILEQMKSRYRFIILDGPPVLPLADVNVLSVLAHIVLMVVRSGSTPKDVVQKALEMIHHTGTRRLVLTDAWAQGVPYYAREEYLIPYSLGSSG